MKKKFKVRTYVGRTDKEYDKPKAEARVYADARGIEEFFYLPGQDPDDGPRFDIFFERRPGGWIGVFALDGGSQDDPSFQLIVLDDGRWFAMPSDTDKEIAIIYQVPEELDRVADARP